MVAMLVEVARVVTRAAESLALVGTVAATAKAGMQALARAAVRVEAAMGEVRARKTKKLILVSTESGDITGLAFLFFELV